MNKGFVMVLLVLFTLYGGFNYYVGIRLQAILNNILPVSYTRYIWVGVAVLALSYFATRLGESRLPGMFTGGLTVAGSYWLAFLFYAVLVFAAVDILRFCDGRLDFLPLVLKQKQGTLGYIALLLIFIIMICGIWNAHNPVVRRYDVTIPKHAGSLKKLNAVIVSDIHLGSIVHRGRLEKMVQMVNELNPDIVLMPGDIIEQVRVFQDQEMATVLRKIKSTHGVYAVPGNHEYIGREPEEAFSQLGSSGMTVLRDSYVKIGDSFYVAGRDDYAAYSFTGKRRKELPLLLAGTDKSKPVFLLDHQPYKLEEARQNGVDLMVSGHTHRGQLFPLNFITAKVFEIDHGYMLKETLHVFVTTGFGTWGPPVRLGNRPEIVNVTINFTGEAN